MKADEREKCGSAHCAGRPRTTTYTKLSHKTLSIHCLSAFATTVHWVLPPYRYGLLEYNGLQNHLLPIRASVADALVNTTSATSSASSKVSMDLVEHQTKIVNFSRIIISSIDMYNVFVHDLYTCKSPYLMILVSAWNSMHFFLPVPLHSWAARSSTRLLKSSGNIIVDALAKSLTTPASPESITLP